MPFVCEPCCLFCLNDQRRWTPYLETPKLEIRRINDAISVSPQITVADIDAVKAAGFVTIVNNRPDGEAPDQQSADDIRVAAEAAGLKFINIPMGREGVTPQMVQATLDALQNSDGPVFAYCRTGTRSTTLWALSQAGHAPADEIVQSAANAGYDMSHLAAHLG